MKQQHTPGPWKTEQRTTKGEFVTETHIVASDGSHIAEVSPCRIEENARLIAAAPDLLVALKLAALCLGHYAAMPHARPDAHKIAATINALIKKAEGTE